MGVRERDRDREKERQRERETQRDGERREGQKPGMSAEVDGIVEEVDGIVEEEGGKWMEVDEHLEEQSGIQDLRQVG